MARGSHHHGSERKVVMSTQLIRNCSVALLAAVSMYAQGSQKMKVQVPFGFHVGNSVLPSGQYTVDADAGAGLLRLSSRNAKSSVVIIALPVPPPPPPAHRAPPSHTH